MMAEPAYRRIFSETVTTASSKKAILQLVRVLPYTVETASLPTTSSSTADSVPWKAVKRSRLLAM